MRGFTKLLAALALALTLPAVTAGMLTTATPAHADPHDRGNSGRGEGRGRGGEGARGDYRAPAYPAPYPGGYSQPYPAYPPGPVYNAPPGGYAYPQPPPGYVPNSLGAGWGQQQDEARSGVRQGRMMPLGQVMQRIKRGTPGRLLDAGLEPGPDGRPAYRVRWAATGGRRIDFIVDAVTGAILGRTGH
jgi:hypothetical protein